MKSINGGLTLLSIRGILQRLYGSVDAAEQKCTARYLPCTLLHSKIFLVKHLSHALL